MKHSKILTPEKNDGGKNAVINWFGHDNETLAIAEGYYRGANYLIDKALDNHEMDTLVYPILFLYRHLIEVILKRIVFLLEALGNTPFKDSKKKNHGLKELFEYIQKECASIWDKPFPENVKETILEFDRIDPKAQAFRYDTDNKYGKKFFKGHIHVGLGQLKDKMKKVGSILMGIEAALSDWNEKKSDIEGEYKDL